MYNPYLARLVGANWLNAQENRIAPGIIDANAVFLLFKRNTMRNQALFDFLQSLMSRNGDHIGLQTGSIRGCGFRSARVPDVQADVMMIATGADEKRSVF